MSGVHTSQASVIRELLALIANAQEILGAHLPPDGVSEHQTINELLGLLDSSRQRDVCGRAEAFLNFHVPSNRKTFFGIVTQFDCSPKNRGPAYGPPCGPIIFEQYLNEHTADRAKVEERSKSMADYGWCVIAEITVEFPAPAAIPAAEASVHE